MTIHSWGAVTPGMHDIEKLISFVKTCKPAHKRWKETKVLIIDEGALCTVFLCYAYIDFELFLSFNGGRQAL